MSSWPLHTVVICTQLVKYQFDFVILRLSEIRFARGRAPLDCLKTFSRRPRKIKKSLPYRKFVVRRPIRIKIIQIELHKMAAHGSVL